MSELLSELTLLDNPAWSSLSKSHSKLAEVQGLARRYPQEVSPFCGIDTQAEPKAWKDLAQLIGPDGVAVFFRKKLHLPSNAEVIFGGNGVQMIGAEVEGNLDNEIVELTHLDVPAMLDLIARTEPGPFAPRTIELGGYIGFKKEEKLVAMAGFRMNPPGWREISAVCTDPEYRGKGMAGRLVRTLVARIKEAGEIPFLHASASNENAIRLYESMGFVLNQPMEFAAFKLL